MSYDWELVWVDGCGTLYRKTAGNMTFNALMNSIYSYCPYPDNLISITRVPRAM